MTAVAAKVQNIEDAPTPSPTNPIDLSIEDPPTPTPYGDPKKMNEPRDGMTLYINNAAHDFSRLAHYSTNGKCGPYDG